MPRRRNSGETRVPREQGEDDAMTLQPDRGGSRYAALTRTLIALLTVGLIWQFVLVMLLVYRERGSLRWAVLKDALWLQAPRSPTTGRVGGRLWLVLIPCALLLLAE